MARHSQSQLVRLLLRRGLGIHSHHILRARGSHKGAAALVPRNGLVDERLQSCGRLHLGLRVHRLDHRAVRHLHLELTGGEVGVEGGPVGEAPLAVGEDGLHHKHAAEGVPHRLVHHLPKRPQRHQRRLRRSLGWIRRQRSTRGLHRVHEGILEKYRAVAVGLKVDADVEVLSRLVQMLHARRGHLGRQLQGSGEEGGGCTVRVRRLHHAHRGPLERIPVRQAVQELGDVRGEEGGDLVAVQQGEAGGGGRVVHQPVRIPVQRHALAGLVLREGDAVGGLLFLLDEVGAHVMVQLAVAVVAHLRAGEPAPARLPQRGRQRRPLRPPNPVGRVEQQRGGGGGVRGGQREISPHQRRVVGLLVVRLAPIASPHEKVELRGGDQLQVDHEHSHGCDTSGSSGSQSRAALPCVPPQEYLDAALLLQIDLLELD
mmetsp:Transcript_28731/g.62941  ORF Transcript_28731/g.62941 Transcript_28731/m.62941 type:complete len:429 (+) Transcript_28731:216-1502(+)